MSGEKFTFQYTEREETLLVDDRSYEFRSDRKYHWLQRLCFYILARIGATRRYLDVTYTNVSFDPETLIHAVDRQIDDVYRRTRRLPSRIIIGARTWTELLKTPKVSRYVELRLTTMHVQGLTVEIVPWMDGIVVLP